MSDIAELAYIGLLILLLGRVAKDNFFSDQASREIRSLREEIRRLAEMLKDDRGSQRLKRNTTRGRKPVRMTTKKVTGTSEVKETTSSSSSTRTDMSR